MAGLRILDCETLLQSAGFIEEAYECSFCTGYAAEWADVAMVMIIAVCSILQSARGNDTGIEWYLQCLLYCVKGDGPAALR
jgi:hypothetical protein